MRTRLQVLSEARRCQTPTAFLRQYDKAARDLNPERPMDRPSRATIHRWLSGNITRLPLGDHCEVLEAMFKPWSAAELFEPWTDDDQLPTETTSPTRLSIDQITESVAAGLSPDAPSTSARDWGLRAPSASTPTEALRVAPASNEAAARISSKLVALSHVLRLTPQESRQLAMLAGSVVDLDLRIDLHIDPDGWVNITYRHDLLNMTTSPFTRWKRELWFKHSDGNPLNIRTTDATGGHQVTLDRVHDAGSLAKFACEFSPPIQPGDSLSFGYTCTGGRFDDEQYWHQVIWLHTRRYTIHVRDERTNTLGTCIANEEYPNGLVESSGEGLIWTPTEKGLEITLTRDHLQLNQTVTVRWSI